jgi:peptidyl-prolyl cis-trans isomerase SurA
MRIAGLRTHILAALSCAPLLLLLSGARVQAQNIVVLVNDEPITTYDVAQRERWLARTNGFGDRMKAALTGDAIKEKFRQKMIAAAPHSEAEAKQAAERIRKELIEDTKRHVLAEGGSASRKAAVDSLIEEKLKLQAAKKLKITITDSEVEETLAQRTNTGNGGDAAGGPQDAKSRLAAFYQQFESDGISRKGIKDIIRAQLAWRDVIRRQYGQRLASLLAEDEATASKSNGNDVQFDVRVLRLAVAGSNDQRAVSARIIEAERLKEKFTSCAELPKQAKLLQDATVRTLDKAKLASFPRDIQPLILKASEGQMTPPVLVGDAVESYAICKKAVAKAQGEQKPDVRQQEYERFSKRYLQELKQAASIDYRGT